MGRSKFLSQVGGKRFSLNDLTAGGGKEREKQGGGGNAGAWPRGWEEVGYQRRALKGGGDTGELGACPVKKEHVDPWGREYKKEGARIAQVVRDGNSILEGGGSG